MLQADYKKYVLEFKIPAGTSRGVLQTKETYFIKIWHSEFPDIVGIGECALFRGLSADDVPEYELKLKAFCQNINNESFLQEQLPHFPSIRFGLDTALKDLQEKGKRILFESPFTKGISGIPINGLIWMGSLEFITAQIKEKLQQGFRCLKFKVGALNVEDEFDLLKKLRIEFPAELLEIRLDANGAFSSEKALGILQEFSKFFIHSIEQPIKAGNIEQISRICKNSPIPVALDEELIGIHSKKEKANLLEEIKPQYIILKPSLTGGFRASAEWIKEAEKQHIGWWITSALESNIGLNAIAQWTYTLASGMVQGLGTGSLFTNNVRAPLYIKEQQLFYNPETAWGKIDF